MSEPRFALFDTAIGPCGLVWTRAGVSGVLLPERDREALRRRLARLHPDAVEAEPQPQEIREAIAGIRALLDGEAVDLSGVPVDLGQAPEFHRRVWAAARTIAPGGTLTYGDVARRVGTVAESRAVGQALGRNPVPVIVPCHRVLAASGRTGGFSAPGGVDTKLRILTIEARHAPRGASLFDDLPLAGRPARA